MPGLDAVAWPGLEGCLHCPPLPLAPLGKTPHPPLVPCLISARQGHSVAAPEAQTPPMTPSTPPLNAFCMRTREPCSPRSHSPPPVCKRACMSKKLPFAPNWQNNPSEPRELGARSLTAPPIPSDLVSLDSPCAPPLGSVPRPNLACPLGSVGQDPAPTLATHASVCHQPPEEICSQYVLQAVRSGAASP